jgi:rRNA-processing protein FCF1
MKQAILDTNFILTCVKQKVDFFRDIPNMGLEILISKQVIEEIKRVANSTKKLKFRDDAKLAQVILERNKFKKIDIRGKYVDKGLIKYAKEHPRLIVATLDREIKSKIMNSKLVIRGKKKLEVQ